MAFGQMINYSISSIAFSTNAQVDFRHSICFILGVVKKENLCTYLGIPSVVGRNRKEVFGYLKDRVWSKLNSWKQRALSCAGKEVLIKTVLQALPNYVMSLFLLPIMFCAELERIMTAYWWGKGIANDRGIHWVGWTRTTRHKALGGLGFKHLRAFNLAILGKQGWNLVSRPDSSLLGYHYWNLGLVDSLFNERDKQLIAAIPLSRIPQVDKLCWKFEEKGMYSVRSAYRFLCGQASRSLDEWRSAQSLGDAGSVSPVSPEGHFIAAYATRESGGVDAKCAKAIAIKCAEGWSHVVFQSDGLRD
ncbi:uncharacterized protein LOC105634449 [Jatropha curcas]|uniref:uncharacterized protein LOC105634449 n=1 Tax=Jatropha curcas TaxID=180498 RepID=UPI0005FAD82B|nr:uncharacterized protein LOC105634449 [Jatropha curcas]